MAAALTLFVERGYAATRVEDVARKAGVSKGTVFLYYENKEALFKAVVRDSISGRYAQWSTEITEYTGPSADLLRRCLLAWWEHIGSTPAGAMARLMLTELPQFPQLAAFYQQEVVEPGNALIAQVLQRGMARGELRPMEVSYGVALVTAPLVWLALRHHGAGGVAHCLGNLDPLTYLNTHCTLLMQGLALPPPPRTE
ncbi:MAG: TetR/AcrR family transcriptional regulator [Rhodoferax sp.]